MAVSVSATAQISVHQPDKLSGNITGYDGRQIQLQLAFSKHLGNDERLTILVNEKLALQITNQSSLPLSRFTTRLRLNRGDTIHASIQHKDGSHKTTFVPTVASDYLPPSKDEFAPNPRITKVSLPQMKALFGAEIGDCLYLLLGVSNTGSAKPREFELGTNFGLVRIVSSEYLSTNPLFSIGGTKEFSTCEINIKS